MSFSIVFSLEIGWTQRVGLNSRALEPQIDLHVCRAITLTYTAHGVRTREKVADEIPKGTV
jgi:hypothetical protein